VLTKRLKVQNTLLFQRKKIKHHIKKNIITGIIRHPIALFLPTLTIAGIIPKAVLIAKTINPHIPEKTIHKYG